MSRLRYRKEPIIVAHGKTAVITGVTGQDGAYLAEFLLKKGYQVIGTHRRTSSVNTWRLHELGVLGHPNLLLVDFDLTDPGSAIALLQKFHPDELYNLAAQSFVGASFDAPTTTALVNGQGALNLLEAIRLVDPRIRYYQASSSEMFGGVEQAPQCESTPFCPRSPYAVSKLFAHWMTINYREAYGMYAVSGILFNHESPLRGSEFVTRKISSAVARMAHGERDVLELGNLDARRDWGFAAEYVEGMWQMMQAEQPGTYVLATGRQQTVRDFVRMAFSVTGISLEFVGAAASEVAIDVGTGRVVASVDPSFFRPAEVDLLVGDASRARVELGWEAHTTVEQICRMMVEADLRRTYPGAR
ncbi:GDP-mannose 4,6-dehydratase [Acidovorax radicis]|uniref:GDP-mannose 4,6-dehydratase n=1 Tax=Acidovorax radicis TaxID=758826 RepID=UPI0002376D38|nr:GDP-mannose 4,6-dehydratase [Acidovorax radicis]